MRIAALSDDFQLLNLVREKAKEMGHTTRGFLDGSSLMANLSRESYDLLVVDFDYGREVAQIVREINRKSVVPTLYLVSEGPGKDFESTASALDDFMCKSSIDEFAPRIRWLVKRNCVGPVRATLTFGIYEFNLDRKTLTMNGNPVALRSYEYKLAVYLFQNHGRVLSRSHMYEAVFGREDSRPNRSIDTYISQIRSKLELRGSTGFVLSPRYGVGYCLHAANTQGFTGQT